MYLVYKNKYGYTFECVGLFKNIEDAQKYIIDNVNINYTMKIEFVEVIKNEN